MPPGCSAAIACLSAALSATGPAGTTTSAVSSNATTPKRSLGSRRSTSASSARLRRLQPLAAPSSRCGRARPARRQAARGRLLRRLGGAKLEQDRQLVGLLDGDELDVDVGVQAHRVLLVVAGMEDGSSPAGDL